MGNEGVVGIAIFIGRKTTASSAVVQTGDHAYRLLTLECSALETRVCGGEQTCGRRCYILCIAKERSGRGYQGRGLRPRGRLDVFRAGARKLEPRWKLPLGQETTAMRNTILSAVTSSILLGAVVAQAGPRNDGGVDSDGDGRLSKAEWSQVSPALSSSFGAIDTNSDGQLTTEEFAAWHDSFKARMGADDQAEPAAAPDQDAVTGGNAADGPARSNGNKRWPSGEYYPNAVGTVGDDPAKPRSTTAPPNAKVKASNKDSGPSNQWADEGADLDGDGSLSLAELKRVSPTLSESFSIMDVDGDQQVSHGEFRSWHQSLKSRMGAE